MLVYLFLVLIHLHPSEATWGQWRTWGVCDGAGCNAPGKQHILRRCESGKVDLCNGKTVQVKVEDCTTVCTTPAPTTPATVAVTQPFATRPPCPQPDECVCDVAVVCWWTPWSTWGSCPQTCGYVQRIRVRRMTGDQPHCQGVTETASEICAKRECPAWTSWTEWADDKGDSSQCTVDLKKCNEPHGQRSYQQRFRTCANVWANDTRKCSCPNEWEETCTKDSPVRTCPDFIDNVQRERTDCNEAPPTTQAPLVAVVTYAVGATGSILLAIICACVFMIFLIDCNYATQRVYHMPQELCLVLGHAGLCVMTQFEEEPLCTIMIGYLNSAFLLYFVLLFLESVHVMSFVAHVIRKGYLIPISIQYSFAIIFVTSTVWCYIHYFLDDIKETVGDQKLCWFRLCQPIVNMTAWGMPTKVLPPGVQPCLSGFPSQIYFVMHVSLFAGSIVATEAGMMQRRHFYNTLPSTDWTQYTDAHVAWSGIYLKIILSYASTIATLYAHHYRVEEPSNPMVYVWSTAALISCTALGVCIAFYHLLGNVLLRRKVRDRMADTFPCFFREYIKRRRLERKEQRELQKQAARRRKLNAYMRKRYKAPSSFNRPPPVASDKSSSSSSSSSSDADETSVSRTTPQSERRAELTMESSLDSRSQPVSSRPAVDDYISTVSTKPDTPTSIDDPYNPSSSSSSSTSSSSSSDTDVENAVRSRVRTEALRALTLPRGPSVDLSPRTSQAFNAFTSTFHTHQKAQSWMLHGISE